MKKRNSVLLPIVAVFMLFFTIFDAKTVISSARCGVDICLNTIIPSLFPFLVLTGFLSGSSIHSLPFLERICKLPTGSAGILLSGLTGGYPSGAVLVSGAYHDGSLDINNAQRMLGFCNNAGPAFIFGMCGNLFETPLAPWLIWGIQILSAVCTGILLPEKPHTGQVRTPQRAKNSMMRSVRAMAIICGWVVLFRIVIDLLKRWLLWLLPESLQAVLSGLLELSNGIIAMKGVLESAHLFLSVNLLLCFGGVCVLLQTASVMPEFSLREYGKAKLLQCSLAAGLSCITVRFLFPVNRHALLLLCIPLLMIPLIFRHVLSKKRMLLRKL